MDMMTARRTAMRTLGIALAAGASGLVALQSRSTRAVTETPEPLALAALTHRLSRAPRRRDFKTVPMILNSPDQWDHEALSEVLAYKPATKQAWDNTDIGGAGGEWHA